MDGSKSGRLAATEASGACPITAAIADAVASELRKQKQFSAVIHPTYLPLRRGFVERIDLITVRWTASRPRLQTHNVERCITFCVHGDQVVVTVARPPDYDGNNDTTIKVPLEQADFCTFIIEWLIRIMSKR